jgi:tetratricopeptide (TPR) repeat protein
MIKSYSEFFELLDETKIHNDAGSKDDFFKSINNSWGAFRESWDFKRDIYINSNFKRLVDGKEIKGCLKERVLKEIDDRNTENNQILLVTGMAGVGKTIMLKRLAYDIYSSGHGPVIFIKSAKLSFDYKMLTSFIEGLNDKIEEEFSEGKHIRPIKPIIIIDDAASLIRHLDRLKTYLASRGKPALIIVAERKSEWDVMFKKFPFKLHKENIYELDENLNDRERNRIIEHFSELGYIVGDQAFWQDTIKNQFESSLFATIYTWVHPAKKPLDEIIKDQYLRLPDLTKSAFRYICAFHQFNISMNIELLVRSLKCSYDTFFNEIIAADSEKVIFEEEDEYNNILYRTHHRIIAQKTIEFFLGDSREQKEIFQDILNSAILTNKIERDNIEKLLVEYIGPNSKAHIFSLEQQRDLFRTICDRYPLRSLVHHWGILESQDRNFPEAERLLKWALKLPKRGVESFRGESDQNILTSLGNLYEKMGRLSGPGLEEEYYDEAEECFNIAKHGDFPNAYAYHAHANMFYKRGNNSVELSEKLKYYAEALKIISAAKDNLGDDDPKILQLETQIWIQVGDEEKIDACLNTISDKYKTAVGYCLYAELLIVKADMAITSEERKIFLERAQVKIEEGLIEFANDEGCLRLKAKLTKLINPKNLEDYYKTLAVWKAVSIIPSALLLFDLGRIAFILQYYENSKKYFRELETGVGIGHRFRFRSKEPILDDKGNPRVFEGSIVKIFSHAEGELRCDTLRNLRYAIPFRPIACAFTPSVGDRVTFLIGFTYRGPRAENVSKMT